MKHIYIVLTVLLLFASCKEKEEAPKEWALTRTTQLADVNPIGITEVDGKLWLSDGDHNRLVQIDMEGNVEKTIDSLDRPMHIDAWNNTIYVPEYGTDAISIIQSDQEESPYLDRAHQRITTGQDSLDAPAGVSKFEDETAIADFYNNRILFSDGSGWISFGKEGKANGEFYYPTDVQITSDKIWVADAYNNRIQVFDKQGNFLQAIGKDQKMNAATGIFVAEKEVFVTDFENDRVLVFDMEGNLKQTLKDGIEKPTDMIMLEDTLYIINYRNGKLLSYQLKPLMNSEP